MVFGLWTLDYHMPRVKRSIIHLKKRRSLKKSAKGYRHGRKNQIKSARVAVLKAGNYAYRDRKAKKRTFRGLWHIKLNAALHEYELSYSKFMHLLKTKNIALDRKVLAQLAENHADLFKKLVEKVK